MTEPVLVRELEEIRDSLQEGFRGVHVRLDTINGRLRDNEGQTRVLVDRSVRDNARLTAISAKLGKLDTQGCAVGRLLHEQGGEIRPPSWWTPRRAAGVTVGGAGVVVAVVEAIKALAQWAGK